MPLHESNLNSNYVCSPVGKPSGHPGVLSSGNMASAPSFQLPTDPIDPGLTPVPTGLRCVHYVGPQSLDRPQIVAVEHPFGEWQPHHTSSPDLVHNDSCIQDRMVCCLPSAWQKKGRWSEDEIRLHINVLELKAAFLALKAISKNQSHRVACLRMHNITATAQINNKGSTGTGSGTCSGGLKTIVDSESRVFNDNSECKINRQLISPFLKECDIDVDALTMNWEPFKGHAFPPFSAKHSNGGRSPEPSDRATSPHPDHQTPFEGSITPSKDSPNVS